MAEQLDVSNDDVRQVQEYTRREFGTLMRPIKVPVYHYTDGGSAASILDQALMRATNILYVDDGREMSHTLGFFRRAMEERQQAHPDKTTTDLNQMITRYLSEVGSYVPPDIWVVTFSAQRDDPEQWREFARGNHGVALGFSPAGITRAAQSSGALLAPCCYDDATKIAIMTRGLDVLERLYAQRCKRGASGAGAAVPLVRYVVRELALFGALMRPAERAAQDEWRLILCNPSQTAVGARRITPLPRAAYTSLYIDLEIAGASDRLPISDVMIGPSAYQQMTVRAFRTLLYKHGYERADVIPSQALDLSLGEPRT